MIISADFSNEDGENTVTLNDREAALVQLLSHLAADGYEFVTPTPATHEINMERRRGQTARTTRDVLGWSMKFRSGEIDPVVERLLYAAGALAGESNGRHSTIRVSTLDSKLFVHSAFPTSSADAVFFGPDSYRFADLIRAELALVGGSPVIVDVGTGAGVGAIVAGTIVPVATIVMTDINSSAIALAQVNAWTAGVPVAAYCGDLFASYEGSVDIALANPPYIIDPAGRLYRDGGSLHGAELSIRMAREVLPRLNPRGRFILYSGSAIVDGLNALEERLAVVASENDCSFEYREIDPDVFGEELTSSDYEQVERIAAIAAVFRR